MIRRGSRPVDKFAMIENGALEDEGLSWRARGLLAYMLSRPEGWKTSANRLAAQSPGGSEGRGAILNALKELEVAGYLIREKVQDDKGRWSTVQTVYGEPQSMDVRSATETGPIGTEPVAQQSSVDVPKIDADRTPVDRTSADRTSVHSTPLTRRTTKTENKKKIPPPQSVASLPPSSEADLPRERTQGWFATPEQERAIMGKLATFPGKEYTVEAAKRWNPSMEDTWFLTCEYVEHVKAKGWSYSPDGWIKYIEDRMTERANRPRRAYAPNGVPL